MIECLTHDRGAAGSSLTCVTELCPWARYINPSLVLVQPEEICPYITERLLMGHKESNQINLCIIGFSSWFLVLCWLFIKIYRTILKKALRNTISVSKNLDPNRGRYPVSPDMVPNCLQMISSWLDSDQPWQVWRLSSHKNGSTLTMLSLNFRLLLSDMDLHWLPMQAFLWIKLLPYYRCLYSDLLWMTVKGFINIDLLNRNKASKLIWSKQGITNMEGIIFLVCMCNKI